MSEGRFDAILLASSGGPAGQDDVAPSLRNATTGRGLPDDRLEDAADHDHHSGGVSPLTAQNRALTEALEGELARRELDLPVFWGTRDGDPSFSDAFREVHAAGHRRILVLIMSAYTSHSEADQYRNDVDRALDETGLRSELELHRIREFFDLPGFVEPFAESLRDALEEAPPGTHVLFVTPSIPAAAADESAAEFGPGGAYVAQHLATAEAILREADAEESPWSLVYQSRRGAPHIPWLEPDINEAIEEIAGQGFPGVIIVPIGFISDDIDVKRALDTQAVETAGSVGLYVERLPTPGLHPAFIAGLVDLVMERVDETPDAERPALTELGPWPDHAPQGSIVAEALPA